MVYWTQWKLCLIEQKKKHSPRAKKINYVADTEK